MYWMYVVRGSYVYGSWLICMWFVAHMYVAMIVDSLLCSCVDFDVCGS